jgi:hypothetical protein
MSKKNLFKKQSPNRRKIAPSGHPARNRIESVRLKKLNLAASGSGLPDGNQKSQIGFILCPSGNFFVF